MKLITKHRRSSLSLLAPVSFFGVMAFHSFASAAFQTEFDEPQKTFENATTNPKTRIRMVQTQCSAYANFALITMLQTSATGDKFVLRTRSKNMTSDQVCSASFQGISRNLPNTGWLMGVKNHFIVFRDKGSGAINQMTVIDAKTGEKIFGDQYHEKQGIELKETNRQWTLRYFKGLDVDCNPIRDPKCFSEVRSKYKFSNEIVFEEPDCRNLHQSAAADSGPSFAIYAAEALIKDLRDPKPEIVGSRILCAPKL